MLKNSKWRSRVIVRARASEVVDEYSDPLEVAASAGASILARFVLFEYNHVVIVIESEYRESDFYDLGRERLSLTILMSQHYIIM